MKPAPTLGPLSKEAEAGPIRSAYAGDTTTVWRDGEAWREDRSGRPRRLPDSVPVREKFGGSP